MNNRAFQIEDQKDNLHLDHRSFGILAAISVEKLIQYGDCQNNESWFVNRIFCKQVMSSLSKLLNGDSIEWKLRLLEIVCVTVRKEVNCKFLNKECIKFEKISATVTDFRRRRQEKVAKNKKNRNDEKVIFAEVLAENQSQKMQSRRKQQTKKKDGKR